MLTKQGLQGQPKALESWNSSFPIWISMGRPPMSILNSGIAAVIIGGFLIIISLKTGSLKLDKYLPHKYKNNVLESSSSIFRDLYHVASTVHRVGRAILRFFFLFGVAIQETLYSSSCRFYDLWISPICKFWRHARNLGSSTDFLC